MSLAKPQFLIAAAASGSGKTTFTMGLLRVLKRRGLIVQPFKCGPDYIDGKFHALAAGRESVNLDTWMASEAHVRAVYSRYAREASACVVEGVMGLFDGYDRMKGSSAEIASLLHLPVIVILNARSSAYTVAAVLYGLKHFCPQVEVAGVIFNQVGSPSHYAYLKEACADVDVADLGYLPKVKDIEVPSRHLGLTIGRAAEIEALSDRVADLGYLPKVKDIEVPSRHLGLTIGRAAEIDALSDRVADLIEQYVDVDRLLALTTRPQEVFDATPASAVVSGESGWKRIAVAQDAAFNFFYKENWDVFSQKAEVVTFSPLAGDALPQADYVYLPGGYPEFFADALSRNVQLGAQLRDFAGQGGRLFAECGGMMYLCRQLVSQEGEVYPMAGVLPLDCTLEKMRLHLGYRTARYRGMQLKGHEFHYSSVVQPDTLPSEVCQYNVKGAPVDTPLYRYRNVIAGYTHWYWGENDFFNLWD